MSKNEIVPVNFSKGSVTKLVRSKMVSHPATVYPLAIGLGGLVGFGLLGMPAMLLVGAAGMGVGVSTWLINRYGRYHFFASKQLEEIQKQMRKEREAKLARIEKDLEELGCQTGSRQLQKQRKNYHMFVEVLDRKLNPLEVTYGRYLGMVEQVYLATLDNLEKVVLLLTSTRSIDRTYIEEQLHALDHNGIDNSNEDYENLRARLQILEDARHKVDRLLNANEQAITCLLTTANKLALLETAPGQSSMAMEDAMAELSHLTKNIALYDRQNL